MTQLLPPKKEVALALLERSNVDVYLDPRAKGVVVPPQFRKEPRLILKIGLNMPVPIPDLRLDDESMSCTLSFNRSPFYCVVPWPSVFAMVGEDGRGMVWPDDVPQELAVKVVDPGSEARLPPDRESEKTTASSRGRAPSSRKGAGGARTDDDAKDSSRSNHDSSLANARSSNGRKSSKKKREEQQRPVLVAVAQESEPPSSKPGSDRAARRPEPAPASARGAETPVSRQPSPNTPSRPKRELPPYLRVVK